MERAGAVRLGANIGLQLGGEETDFVLLVMNPKEVESLLKSKVKLGADAAAATDVLMRAEILSYSCARGLFAGVSLEGSTLHPDSSANHKLYGRELVAREIVSGKVATRRGRGDGCHAAQALADLSDPKSLREVKTTGK